MIDMLAVLLAAQFTMAPQALQALLAPEDAPLELLENNVQARVGIAITAMPDGRPLSCRIETSSGNPRLDNYTCKLLRRRAKFEPASLSTGEPVHAVYRTVISWWAGTGMPELIRTTADLYLTVAALPPGVSAPHRLRLNFMVDQQGMITHCVAENPNAHPDLTKVACAHLRSEFKPLPARDSKGHPVQSVQDAAVLFVKS